MKRAARADTQVAHTTKKGRAKVKVKYEHFMLLYMLCLFCVLNHNVFCGHLVIVQRSYFGTENLFFTFLWWKLPSPLLYFVCQLSISWNNWMRDCEEGGGEVGECVLWLELLTIVSAISNFQYWGHSHLMQSVQYQNLQDNPKTLYCIYFWPIVSFLFLEISRWGYSKVDFIKSNFVDITNID